MSGSAALPRVASGDASSEIVAQASEDAARAAAAARVRIAVAGEVAQFQTVSQFFAQVWMTAPGGPPLPADVMRAMVHADGAVHLALGEDGLAGATAMIFCSPASASVYSLIAAARSSDRGVGFALKQAQRAWALERGATSMTWTFDPLIGRNARFNLVKLGAVAPSYEVDFYGQLNDGIDGQGDTDRLVATWSLTSPRTIEAARGGYANVAGPYLPGVELDRQRAPDGGPLSARDQHGRWCRVPPDIMAVRRADQPLADRWRSAVREALQSALAEGLAATGFSRDGWYRLTPHRTDGESL